MSNEDISEEKKEKLAEDFADWKRQLLENQDSLLDLQYQFFESSLKYLTESRDRMIDDQMRFGKESFQKTSASERLQLKSKEVANLTAQLLRTKNMMLRKERSRIREDLVKLADNENLEQGIESVEKEFFKKQIEIYDVDLKILEEDENLTRMILKDFLKDVEEEEDIFYEAFEEQPEDEERSFQYSPTIEDGGKGSDELRRKQEWIKKLNKIFRKRAWLRTKRRKCERERKSKIDARQAAEDNFKLHHAIQLKRDRDKEELEKKKLFIQDMRKKTIERLKHFKKKYPEPIIKRPPRYLPPVRRTRSGRSSPASKREESICNIKPKLPDKSQTGTVIEDSADGTRNFSSVPSMIPTPPPLPPSLAIPPPPPPPPPPQPVQGQQAVSKPNVGSGIKHVASAKDAMNAKGGARSNPAKQKGTSDTVDLKQIIFARQNLRKRTQLPPNDKSCKDTNVDIMSLIRNGVKLKKVETQKFQTKDALSDIAASMLRNTLAKMNKHMADSSDEEEDDDDEEEFI